LLVLGDAANGCHFVGFDGNGNVSTLTKTGDGTISAQYEYGPFGEGIRAGGPMAKPNPLRFSTKYQDGESDLIYYGYRYLNPVTAAWTKRDPAGERAGWNLYCTLGNCPLGKVDRLGLETQVFPLTVLPNKTDPPGLYGPPCGYCTFVITVSSEGAPGNYTRVRVEWTEKKGYGGCVADFQGASANGFLDFGGTRVTYGNVQTDPSETGTFPDPPLTRFPPPPGPLDGDPANGSPAYIQFPSPNGGPPSIPYFDFEFDQYVTCWCGAWYGDPQIHVRESRGPAPTKPPSGKPAGGQGPQAQ
jgi:RHS repeat-associated protein